MGKSKQKTVKVIKEPCDRQHYYTAINLEAIENAASQLSGDGFKLWIYFAKNQDKYNMSLSSKHAEQTFNLTKARYDNGIHELIKYGFLIDVNTDPNAIENLWEFHEVPASDSQSAENEGGFVDNEYKPLSKANTSIGSNETKAQSYDNTRNTTKNIITTKKTFDQMTDKERKKAFLIEWNGGNNNEYRF